MYNFPVKSRNTKKRFQIRQFPLFFLSSVSIHVVHKHTLVHCILPFSSLSHTDHSLKFLILSQLLSASRFSSPFFLEAFLSPRIEETIVMGNKLGRKRQVVEERYTKPQQGLYMSKDVDIKKLKKLILESKLAPCYPGDDESSCNHDLEECPICFLYYPSLNRSRCCMKSICTECFLRMKNPNSAQPTQCPFCKTYNYAVEYRGGKTKEEKSIEQIEEQRVIEAKIRIRQKEVEEEEERMQKRIESFSSSTSAATVDTDYRSAAEDEEIVSSQESCVTSTSHPQCNRDGELDFDLEDIMVMEAIWLSVQEPGNQRKTVPDEISSEDRHNVQPLMPSSSSSSPSGGLACAIAVLAERQQMVGESSSIQNANVSSSYNRDSGNSNNASTIEVEQDSDQHYLQGADARRSNMSEDSGCEISRGVTWQ